MDLAEFRKSRGLSQEECAPLWGVKYKGSVSAIETGSEKPSLEVALRIQVWSEGKILASDLRPDFAELLASAARLQVGGTDTAPEPCPVDP
jgi:transcriptional regulator with XRE-family HTH domain